MFKLQSYNAGVGLSGWSHIYLGHGITDDDACFDTLETAIDGAKELVEMWPESKIRVIYVESPTDDDGSVVWINHD